MSSLSRTVNSSFRPCRGLLLRYEKVPARFTSRRPRWLVPDGSRNGHLGPTNQWSCRHLVVVFSQECLVDLDDDIRPSETNRNPRPERSDERDKVATNSLKFPTYDLNRSAPGKASPIRQRVPAAYCNRVPTGGVDKRCNLLGDHGGLPFLASARHSERKNVSSLDRSPIGHSGVCKSVQYSRGIAQATA